MFNTNRIFQKLRTVIYHVSDLNKARDWYSEITGISPYFNEPYYAGFNIGGFELGLDPDFSGIQAGNTSIAYCSVKGINDSGPMLKLGATLKDEVKEVGGSIQVAIVEDPYGNSIGLTEGA